MKSSITLVTSALAAALLTFATPALASGRDTARGGAADLVQRVPRAGVNAATLGPRQAATQPCSLCQTIRTTQVVREGKRNLAKTVPVEKHLCGECKTSIQHSGHGKANTEKAVHTCAATTSIGACCAR